ncbi:hypothetical protein K0M31_005137 [Melipona bicolor]|uniref:Uncharacterized protein n=1 Tax=Melipona bicolor TaxID=60889 RepID=A0AA40KN08_9HYME|nr:hypothetical protein K0M31_005137 [Melipona bicolor]
MEPLIQTLELIQTLTVPRAVKLEAGRGYALLMEPRLFNGHRRIAIAGAGGVSCSACCI